MLIITVISNKAINELTIYAKLWETLLYFTDKR